MWNYNAARNLGTWTIYVFQPLRPDTSHPLQDERAVRESPICISFCLLDVTDGTRSLETSFRREEVITGAKVSGNTVLPVLGCSFP